MPSISTMPLTNLLLLFFSARLLGQIFKRWNQPALLGELSAGILLGPALLNWVQPTPELSGVAELGVFFLVMLEGLEMDTTSVFRGLHGRKLGAVALSFALPFACGIGLGIAFGQDGKRTLILGSCLSITALPVVVHLLGRPGMAGGPLKRTAVASAVFSDLLAMFALGILFHLPERCGFNAVAMVVADTTGRMLVLALSLAVAAAFVWGLLHLRDLGSHVRLDRALDRLERALGTGSTFEVALVFVLAFSSFSEHLGFHGIMGAFFAALLLQPDLLGEDHFTHVEQNLRIITEGFFGPIFFAVLGLHFSTEAFADPVLLATVLAVGATGKLAAGFLGGLMAGLGRVRSLALATLLNGRGMMELVVAEIALNRGLIGEQIFSDLVLLGALSTLGTCAVFPVLRQRSRRRHARPREAQAAPPSTVETS